MVCKLYVRLCRKWGPRWNGQRLTVSAWAWVRAQETGDKWWRNRIDGLALFLRGEANHCQACFQRHQRRSTKRTGS